MKDFATSRHFGVQAQLDRLASLSLPQGRLGLDTIRELLVRLGDPHMRMPPAFHVAGTNGKGSVCAFLRAMLEAEGLTVHATISPHLVRYNERIRIAGGLVDDDLLAQLLGEVLDHAQDLDVSFFETTIAAAFLGFSRHPADACVIETGMGGRFDATSVLPRTAASGIVSLGMDHERFLLEPEDGAPTSPLARIAFEKAGIIRPGSPVATLSYPPEAEAEIERAAAVAGAPLHMRGKDWDFSIGTVIEYSDHHGSLTLPLPTLPGLHQAANAALAAAMLRHQDVVAVSDQSLARGIASARWPARLQRLSPGPLTALLPNRTVWLDGGHNSDAGAALARHFSGQPLHLVLGMLANKDPRAIVGPLGAQLVSVQVVPVPGHESHPTAAFENAREAHDVASAFSALPEDGLPVLIAGSLYLAGEVLRLNDETPD